ncbi:MAG TPA: hypothetical protein ENK34_07180 [Rhodobacteraceae bacterium]|nr:hypothetical protein [Paracoccaceae bacterium]
MITILDPTDWNLRWETPIAGEWFIDLRGIDKKHRIIRKIGRTLRGGDSPLINGNSLDAMIDVVADWFTETWGTNRIIYIAGGKSLECHGVKFALDVTLSIEEAFMDTIYDRALNYEGVGISEEFSHVSVYLCMN